MSNASSGAPVPPPGYLLVGMTVGDLSQNDPVQSARYGELAGKAAANAQADISMLAIGAGEGLEILEGSVSAGSLVVERYRSIEALLAFWNSPEYEEAKPIRRGFKGMTFEFLVAFEGVDEATSGPAFEGDGPFAFTLGVAGPRTGKAPDPEAYAAKARVAAEAVGRTHKPRTFAQVPADGIHVLEGDWPYEGGLILKQHPSAQVVRDFWQHPSYVEARTHRNAMGLQALLPAAPAVPAPPA